MAGGKFERRKDQPARIAAIQTAAIRVVVIREEVIPVATDLGEVTPIPRAAIPPAAASAEARSMKTTPKCSRL
jgi:hypothetical protein